MHDVLEGICQYDMALFLHYFIVTKKYFDLDTLNNLITGFDYGYFKNKPANIDKNHLNNKKIIMSASEMHCFMKFIVPMISHLIPNNDIVWNLLKQLSFIVDIVTSDCLNVDADQLIEHSINEYLSLLSLQFPGCLKPKHHFLLHYPRIFKLAGPLWNICSIKGKAKHREGKRTSRVTLNRINVCKTLAIENQLTHNYRLLKLKYQTDLEKKKNNSTEPVVMLPGIKVVINCLPDKLQKESHVITVDSFFFLKEKT